MKKFTNLLLENETKKYFEILAKINLIVKASSEGEAGYLADSILGDIEEQTDFIVQNISELSEEDFKKQFESYGLEFQKPKDNSDLVTIQKTWEAEFGERTPTTSEKMEFYHNMRLAGFDGILIMNALKNKISDTWIKKQLESTQNRNWNESGGFLQKTFEFKDFKEALDFINKVGIISESMNHHPEIINNYNKVHLKLKTHDKNQITELDHKMAKKVDDLFNI